MYYLCLEVVEEIISSSILRGMLLDADDLTATAATVCLLQRVSETYAELSQKKLGQSTSPSASCILEDLLAVSCSL